MATRISWSPLSGLKGVQPPLLFGESTRDCSPGHAGKEGPHLSMMGASQGFPLAAPPVGVFSLGTTRITGSLSCGAREVRSPCTWREGARLLGAGMRHSAHGKGHEEGGSSYAKAGSSLRSPPGNPEASTPISRACLVYYFALFPTPLTLQGAVSHHLFRRSS